MHTILAAGAISAAVFVCCGTRVFADSGKFTADKDHKAQPVQIHSSSALVHANMGPLPFDIASVAPGAQKIASQPTESTPKASPTPDAGAAQEARSVGSQTNSAKVITEAHQCYRRQLAIVEAVQGKDTALVAHILENLGQLLKAEGNAVESQQCLDRASAIRLRTHTKREVYEE